MHLVHRVGSGGWIGAVRLDLTIRTAPLVAEHGADVPIPTLLSLLLADYPKQLAARGWDVCGIHCPQLALIC